VWWAHHQPRHSLRCYANPSVAGKKNINQCTESLLSLRLPERHPIEQVALANATLQLQAQTTRDEQAMMGLSLSDLK
jgi:hypothetical protein